MDHVERDRRVARAGNNARLRDVFAAEHTHRRVGVAVTRVARLAALAVEKALHATQEGHELVVVALVEAPVVAGVLVDDLAPRRRLAQVAQHLPRRAPRLTGGALERQHAQRPQQHLAQVAHRERLGALGLRVHGRGVDTLHRQLSLCSSVTLRRVPAATS